ncbi:autotransporter assembly complex family protein [Methylothermus subterraneus]
MTVWRSILPWALAFAAEFLAAAERQPEIRIEGVTGELRRNVQVQLSLADETCSAPRWRVQNAFAAAESQIRKALRALGYYRPVIRSQFAFTLACWQAYFLIEPGPRVRLAEVDVEVFGEAKDDPKFQEWLAKLSLKPGDFLHHGHYEDLKRRLLDLAAQEGYFDARLVKHELNVDPARNLAWIRLHLDSGRRYSNGQIDIQQEILDPSFVRRYLPFRPGDPYSAPLLTQAYQALTDSGYFEDVEVRALPEQAQNLQVPIRIRLLARKRHFFKAGVGFDTNTGPRGTLGYENRRLNRLGHRLEFLGRLSLVRSELGAAYRIPWTDPAKETLSLQTGYLHERTDTLRSDSAGLGVRFFHPRQALKETLGMDLKYESSRIHGGGAQAALFLVPTGQWSYVHADDVLRPKRGFKTDLTLRAGSALVGGPARFLQAQGYAKGVYQFPWQGRVLTRLELGATWTDRFAKLPATYRFFTGGDTSVRGYGYKRLGPKNQAGEVIGGRYLGVVSLEYEQPFWKNFGAAVFADAGNAFLRLTEPIQIGAGLGLRWYSPLGPLRLDLAVPLSKPGFGLRVHVSMGAEL